MDFKFYKTTDADFVNQLKAIKDARKAYHDHIQAIAKEVGAYEWMQYGSGAVACFMFEIPPSKEEWKKSERGYMPKLGNKDGKALQNRINEVKPGGELNQVLEQYKFPMMVLGSATPRGIAMHNSHLCGKFDQGVFFVKVPTTKNCKFKAPDIFTEVKEWEMLKFMEEGE